MNPMATLENIQTAFRTLREIIPNLSSAAWLHWRKMPSYWRPEWPWELELSIDGRDPIFGGATMVRGTGQSPEEAWANLLRALG